LFGYVRLSLRELSRYRPQPLVLDTDAGRREVRPFLLTFANGPQYGSGAVINPGGKLDDGRLEIVIIDDASLAASLVASPRLFLGGIERMSGYTRLSVTHATVTGDSGIAVHRDGDPESETQRVEVALQPRALTVVTPAATPGDVAGPFAP
jgi:diacylglycerol kinase family enzyme